MATADKILFVGNESRIPDLLAQELGGGFQLQEAKRLDLWLDSTKDQGPFSVVVYQGDFWTKEIKSSKVLHGSSEFPEPLKIALVKEQDVRTALDAVRAGELFLFLTEPVSPAVLAKAVRTATAAFRKRARANPPSGAKGSARTGKKILVVDDDPDTRSFLAETLRSLQKFVVLTAENGEVAVRVLETVKIDLLITDLDMPVVNGMRLLSFIKANAPETPCFLLTWMRTTELEKELHALGLPVSRCLEKPVEGKALCEMVMEELEAQTSGRLHGVATATFLQLVEMEEKTCTLTVRKNGKHGTLYFLKGGLIGAETGTLTGEDAAYEIIGWEESMIEVRGGCQRRERQIEKPLMLLLMEATRRRDERAATAVS